MRLRLPLVLLATTTVAGLATAAALAPALSSLRDDGPLVVVRLPPAPSPSSAPVVGEDFAGPAPSGPQPAREAASSSSASIEPYRGSAFPSLPLPLLPDDGMLLGLGASGTPLPHGELLLARAAAAPPPLPARDVRHASPLDAAASPGDAGPSSGDSPSGTGAWGDGGSFGGSAHASGAAVAAPPSPGAAQAAAVALAGSAALGLLGLAGVALYHRIRPTTTLENDTRKAIFDAVSQTPGLGVHAIAASAGVSYSTATYHLERLVSAGMLVMTPDGNRLCYYQNGGAFTESERRILPLLKNDEAARLFETILLNPGTYRAALAERLGVTATTINWHLRRLREADLVRESRQGRSAYLYANALAIEQALPALAQKLTASDLDVAERIRRYTGAPPASASS